jgi:acetoin utilization deacetylase AcuC-like enzyme
MVDKKNEVNNMVFYYPEGHQEHKEYGHPERPERVEKLRQAITDLGAWDVYPKLQPTQLSEEILHGIHSPTYLARLQEACQRGSHLDADTYTTTASWNLAIRTAGGALSVASAVWNKKASRGFALTRPPGHHATQNRGMGFCLLNSVALAAEYLLQEQGAERLAIIDLDLHHGNGTQDIFWQREDVFYISTHQSPLYPGTGSLNEIGAGDGEGYTANFPLPPGTGDEGFDTIMETFILPLLSRYRAEMILVSFGFDPHWLDPLGHLQLSANGYGQLIKKLSGWADEYCQGRIALFLEGGYDLEAGMACGQAVTSALLDQPWQDPLGPAPKPEGESWQIIARHAKEIWQV